MALYDYRRRLQQYQNHSALQYPEMSKIRDQLIPGLNDWFLKKTLQIVNERNNKKDVISIDQSTVFSRIEASASINFFNKCFFHLRAASFYYIIRNLVVSNILPAL